MPTLPNNSEVSSGNPKSGKISAGEEIKISCKPGYYNKLGKATNITHVCSNKGLLKQSQKSFECEEMGASGCDVKLTAGMSINKDKCSLHQGKLRKDNNNNTCEVMCGNDYELKDSRSVLLHAVVIGNCLINLYVEKSLPRGDRNRS